MGMNPTALLTAGVGRVTRPPTVNHRQLLLPRLSLKLNILNADTGYLNTRYVLKKYKRERKTWKSTQPTHFTIHPNVVVCLANSTISRAF
jgi:hypothetical protein